MELKKIKRIQAWGTELCLKEATRLYWATLKEQYLKLTDDKEKEKFLAMIFKSMKKEG